MYRTYNDLESRGETGVERTSRDRRAYKIRICSSSSINKVSSDQALKYLRNTQPPLKVSATRFVSGNDIHTQVL